MKTLTMANPALINQNTSGNEKEPTNMHRRTLIGGTLLALLATPGRVMASHEKGEAKDPLVLLLNGPYQPVVNGPDLGLSRRLGVNLNDGSFVTTKIFPVHVEGIPCKANENTAIGNFYVQPAPPGRIGCLPTPRRRDCNAVHSRVWRFKPFRRRAGRVFLEWNLGAKDPGHDRDFSTFRRWS
jgi:hypothetical protein